MNLQQVMEITECRWAYYGFEDIGFKPTPKQALSIINILSSKSNIFIARAMQDHLCNKLLTDVFDVDLAFINLLSFCRSLVSNHFQAISCLSEYLNTLSARIDVDAMSNEEA